MNEKRSNPRIEENLGIAVNVMSEQGPEPQKEATIFHITKDISRGGIQFVNEYELSPDSLLKVHIALKTPLTTITHFARVKWCRKSESEQPFAIGVQFTDTTAMDTQIWSNYVEQRLHAVPA